MKMNILSSGRVGAYRSQCNRQTDARACNQSPTPSPGTLLGAQCFSQWNL